MVGEHQAETDVIDELQGGPFIMDTQAWQPAKTAVTSFLQVIHMIIAHSISLPSQSSSASACRRQARPGSCRTLAGCLAHVVSCHQQHLTTVLLGHLPEGGFILFKIPGVEELSARLESGLI